jgi:hypothetical protein
MTYDKKLYDQGIIAVPIKISDYPDTVYVRSGMSIYDKNGKFIEIPSDLKTGKRARISAALMEVFGVEDTDLARHLASKGGSSKSEAKAASCRENGKKGGRPKKV